MRLMRKCNNARYFYLQRLFSAILRAYHVLNLPGVRGWRGAGQMGDCIGRLVAAGVEQAAVGNVASGTSRFLVVDGGVISTLQFCASGRSHQHDRPAGAYVGSSHCRSASGHG
jgi:hypothetical protein